MRSNHLTLPFAYLRLSREEARNGESSSISNQRSMIESYCRQNGFTLVRCFTDDGWSGGNFDRPGFQAMMRELEYNGERWLVMDSDPYKDWNGVILRIRRKKGNAGSVTPAPTAATTTGQEVTGNG